jgi:Pyruvate/2-oxoacid:ferredoxin oxidoreductase gamma subunit
VYGEYGGEMRGGKSLVNVVIGANRLKALPVVANASHAIALHQKYWDEILPRIASDALVVTDSAIRELLVAPGRTVQVLPAGELAQQAGSVMASGFVMLAGFAAMTGIVQLDSLIAAMLELVPSYRRQHIETNQKALRLGAAAVTALSTPLIFSAA